jgi:toxin ParE1/3/4
VTVKFTASAKRQFLNGLAYIRRDKPSAARKFREKAETTLARLAEFPYSGRRIPEFPDLAYREVIVRPHRFFYRIEGTTVWIVAVWHSAQLPDEPEDSSA